MKPKVLLTWELPAKAMEYLRAHVELSMLVPGKNSQTELIEALKGQDGLISLLTDKINSAVMDANPALKVIANVAVGYDNIDIPAATNRGIPVTNTPGVLTDTSADQAFALLMASARRVAEMDKYVRDGKWQGWSFLQNLGTDVFGATLGVIGLGRIGKAVVRRAIGFDMEVLYWNRTRLSAGEEKERGLTYVSMEELLKRSDFVSLNVAYNRETHHLIGAEQFRLMKSTAHIINTSRGGVIDEQAMVDALKAGEIAGAGLDVFEREPIVHPDLLEMDNVVLAPHLGSATIATRTKMAMTAIHNLLAVINGERPPNLVNPEVYA